MLSQLVPDDLNGILVGFGLVLLAAITLALKVKEYLKKSVEVPGLGYGSIPYIGSWVGAIRFTLNPREHVRLGYDRYHNGIFKISTLQREHVIVCDKAKIQEFVSAPDTVLSIEDALEQDIQGRWTIGYGLWDHLYHISYVRTQFAPNMVKRFCGMQREVQNSLDELVGDPEGTFAYRPFSISSLLNRL